MNITIAQLNSIVGDITGNLARVKEAITGLNKETDLIVFPELFITGSVPRDLLKLSWFIKKAEEAVMNLVKFSAGYPDLGIIIGAPLPTGERDGIGLYNAALLISGGEILLKQAKSILPSYDISDDGRYFDPSPGLKTIPFKDEILGLTIAEDAGNYPGLWEQRFFPTDPMADLAKKGATIFINIASSPFTVGGDEVRFNVLKNQARHYRIPLLFVNAIGGNDELIFDGGSLLLDQEGRVVELFPYFEELIAAVDTSLAGIEDRFRPRDKIESIHDALVLGLRDYMKKCGFIGAIIGLSGGIDSAVTCALAVEAAGSKNVSGIAMPSIYTSDESNRLAEELAENLEINLTVIPISPIFESYTAGLGDHLEGDAEKKSLAMENIQARIRGNILMTFSNRFGPIVLSTGNKSESATGYCTLYGDLTGGLAVISDLFKTTVYELAEYINRQDEIIPRGIIDRPPSAELKPDQTDQDTLLPYPLLDRILRWYLEEGRSADEIEAMGIDSEVIDWVIRAIAKSEYK
ncbi:MAG TPA: NAD+ synthase, partial [Proteobacteria bacterium]|nr:NAD+ synthase [Pseudomonadota bacterium]